MDSAEYERMLTRLVEKILLAHKEYRRALDGSSYASPQLQLDSALYTAKQISEHLNLQIDYSWPTVDLYGNQFPYDQD